MHVLFPPFHRRSGRSGVPALQGPDDKPPADAQLDCQLSPALEAPAEAAGKRQLPSAQPLLLALCLGGADHAKPVAQDSAEVPPLLKLPVPRLDGATENAQPEPPPEPPHGHPLLLLLQCHCRPVPEAPPGRPPLPARDDFSAHAALALLLPRPLDPRAPGRRQRPGSKPPRGPSKQFAAVKILRDPVDPGEERFRKLPAHDAPERARKEPALNASIYGGHSPVDETAFEPPQAKSGAKPVEEKRGEFAPLAVRPP